MTAKGRVRSVLHRFGFDVHRFETGLLSYTKASLEKEGIELVLDVGANEGQFARQLRTLGYAGELWSFEPGSAAYKALARASARDPRWKTHAFGLSETTEDATLNIAGNSVSSSLLPMAQLHLDAARKSAYVAEEQVQLRCLDDLDLPPVRTWLKIDTQGSELPVLRGGPKTLEQVRVLQLEVSFAPLYEGQSAYTELLPFVLSLGFQPVFVESAMQDADGRMLQVEALFVRAGS